MIHKHCFHTEEYVSIRIEHGPYAADTYEWRKRENCCKCNKKQIRYLSLFESAPRESAEVAFRGQRYYMRGGSKDANIRDEIR